MTAVAQIHSRILCSSKERRYMPFARRLFSLNNDVTHTNYNVSQGLMV